MAIQVDNTNSGVSDNTTPGGPAVPLPCAVPCRSCGVLVKWVAHERTERRMPINVEPAPLGNVWILPDGGHYRIACQGEIGAWRGRLYVSHFATCPQRAAWRKG